MYITKDKVTVIYEILNRTHLSLAEQIICNDILRFLYETVNVDKEGAGEEENVHSVQDKSGLSNT